MISSTSSFLIKLYIKKKRKYYGRISIIILIHYLLNYPAWFFFKRDVDILTIIKKTWWICIDDFITGDVHNPDKHLISFSRQKIFSEKKRVNEKKHYQTLIIN